VGPTAEQDVVRLTYRDRVLANIERYTPTDREDVVRFRALAYGPDAFFSQPEYVTWMYEQSPQSDGEAAPMWLFRSDGTIEGQQGSRIATLSIDGEPHVALWSTELVVSPEYLMRGVGAILSSVVSSASSVVLAFEVTDHARKVLLRNGWTDLGAVPLYVRFLDVGAALASRGRRVPSFVAAAANLAVRAVDAGARALTSHRRLRLEETGRFDERSDTVWSSSVPYYPVITRRDADELNWRYVDFPLDGWYRCFYAYRRDAVVGHAVLRIGRHHGLRAGWIVDYLCPPSSTYGLLSACTHWLRKAGAEAVYCIQQEGPAARAFRAMGFIRRSTGWLLMVKATALPGAPRDSVLDPGKWFITAGDGNVDHPREGTVYAT
jgi:hypothetical protein